MSNQEFNSASRLPPVGCNLVIMVGNTEMVAVRTGYIGQSSSKKHKFEALIEYQLEATKEIIQGRFEWRYT